MKIKILVSILAVALLSATAFAQQDPKDAGAADSLILSFSHLPDLATGDSSVVVEIYALNDNALGNISSAFTWNTSSLHMDTAYFSATAMSAFNLTQLVFYKNSSDSSNAAKIFQCTGLRIFGAGLAPGRTLVATYEFHVAAAIDSIVIDTTAFIKLAYVTAVGNIEFVPRFSGRLVHKFPQAVEIINTGSMPTRFELSQNYPNPFNPSTTFEFALPKATQVELAIFNVLGQRVVTLVNRELPPGVYKETWNGTSESGSPVASGIYFYRLSAGDYVSTKKMMMLK